MAPISLQGLTMLSVILVAHILVSIVLIVVVLLQRSEGGALGVGGSAGAGGGLVSGASVAGALVRTTIIFGAIFFATSLILTTLSTRRDDGGRTEIERDLQEEFAPADDREALGLGEFEDLVVPGVDILSNDPFAETPSTPAQVTTPEAPAPDTDLLEEKDQ